MIIGAHCMYTYLSRLTQLGQVQLILKINVPVTMKILEKIIKKSNTGSLSFFSVA